MVTKKTEATEELAVDTKLSKSEAIDLILLRAREEVTAQIEDLRKELNQYPAPTKLGELQGFDVESFLKNLPLYNLDVEKGTVQFHFSYSNGFKFKPTKGQLEGACQRKRINKEIAFLHSRLGMMASDKDQKLHVLRSLVERTAQGKKFLAEIDALTINPQKRLLKK